MTALTSPKGPLPARVYWIRRVVALSVLFVLVFGTTRIFSGGDEPDRTGSEQATTVAAPIRAAQEKAAREKAGANPSAAPSAVSTPTPTPKPTPTETPKPVPTGPCANGDVMVAPKVAGPRTSLKVKVDLTLRSRTAEACTFEVSSKSVVVKIDSGPRERPDDIWSSSQCPEAVPTKKVTLYKEFDTVVGVTWSGRRSDSTCSDRTSWAKRGWYHVNAATYGGEPQAKQFEVTRPSPVTVTRTVEPKPVEPATTKKPTDQATPTASAKPSGAVEPEL